MTNKFIAVLLLLSASLSSRAQDNTDKKSGSPDIPGTFTVELGLNRGMNASDNFKLGLFGSRTINLYYQYEMRILKSKFSFVPGIGLSLERFKFRNGATINYRDEGRDSIILLTPLEHQIGGLRKSQLITNYVEIPLELRFTSNPDDPARSFKISVGGRIGYLYDAFSKIKYKQDGETKQLKDKQNFNLNRLRYGVYTKVGIGNFSVFSYYNLTSLFETDKGIYEQNQFYNDLNTFTVGISLSSF